MADSTKVTSEIEAAIREADEWLNSHRVSETWRTMNRLRDTLVRRAAEPEVEWAVIRRWPTYDASVESIVVDYVTRDRAEAERVLDMLVSKNGTNDGQTRYRVASRPMAAWTDATVEKP